MTLKKRRWITVDPLTLELVRKAIPDTSDKKRFQMLWKYNLIRFDFILGEKFKDRETRMKRKKKIKNEFNF